MNPGFEILLHVLYRVNGALSLFSYLKVLGEYENLISKVYAILVDCTFASDGFSVHDYPVTFKNMPILVNYYYGSAIGRSRHRYCS